MDAKTEAKEMLERMRQKRGKGLPSFLEVICEELPEVLVRHIKDKRFAMDYTEMPDRYKILICLSAAAVLGDEDMIESFIQAGKTHDVPSEEIVHTILLARYVKSSTVLKDSAEGLALLD